MKITKEQLHDLWMALYLGDYFVEGQDPTGEQYEIDKQRMVKAWEIIKQIEVTQ
jgi:hypothetical protein